MQIKIAIITLHYIIWKKARFPIQGSNSQGKSEAINNTEIYL